MISKKPDVTSGEHRGWPNCGEPKGCADWGGETLAPKAMKSLPYPWENLWNGSINMYKCINMFVYGIDDVAIEHRDFSWPA